MVDLVIRNGLVVTPGGVVRGGLAIDGERIAAVGADTTLPQARRVIDAREQWVIPGLIDAHVHMGSEEDASIEDGLRENMPVETDGALHGGVTTFAHFVGGAGKPLAPAIATTIREGNRWSRVDFFMHAFIMGEDHLAEQPCVYGYGVTSFKHFFNAYKPRNTEDPGFAWLGGPIDAGQLYRSLRFCAQQGYPAVGIVHAEDIDLISAMEQDVRATGRADLAAWTEARPNVAEAMRIRMAIDVARTAGAPIYIAHMSTGEGADLVAEARRRGEPVWAEVGPSWLTHTAEMEREVGCWGKVNPPLRYARDIDRLWRGLHDNGVTCLGTDHGTGGRTRAMKEKGGGRHDNIWNARAGVRGGLEHLLPVMMTFGVNRGRISMEDLARVGSTNTAKVFGLYPRKGALVAGADADIVIVDADREETVDDRFYHCLCDVSIYHGWQFKGMARTTLVRGRVMMEDFETVEKPGWGAYVPRGPAARMGIPLG